MCWHTQGEPEYLASTVSDLFTVTLSDLCHSLDTQYAVQVLLELVEKVKMFACVLYTKQTTDTSVFWRWKTTSILRQKLTFLHLGSLALYE